MLLLHSENIPERMKMNTKSYSELCKLQAFEERFRYLKLDGVVGKETFGFKRIVNQNFYHSPEWLRFRDKIILRDNGCDLGLDGYTIYGPVMIHHLNPITYEDIVELRKCVFDPENVICTKLDTHNAIHYGDENLLMKAPAARVANDTCPWVKTKERE